MKDFFADAFAPNSQGKTNAFGDNPDTYSLAGLLRSQGVPSKEAFVQAAQMNHNREQNEMQKQQMEQKQALEQQKMLQQKEQMGMVSQILGQNGGDPRTTLAALMQTGIDPRAAAAIVSALPQPQWVNNSSIPGGGSFISPPGSVGGNTGMSQASKYNMQPGMSAPTISSNQGIEDLNPSIPDEHKAIVDIKKSRALTEDKYLESIKEEKRQFQKLDAPLSIIENNLKNVTTGTYSDARKMIGKAAKGVFGSELGTGATELEQIDMQAQKLILPVIESSKGAMSNDDRKFFISGVAGSGSLPESNKLFIDGARAASKRSVELFKAAEEWKGKFGSLQGFEQAWDNYLDKNSLITTDKQGKSQIDKNKISNWREFIFKDRMKSPEQESRKETATEAYRRLYGDQ